MKYKYSRGVTSLLFAVSLFAGSAVLLHPQTQSASLTSASITLSNSRLSFKARLASGNTTGSSIVTIKTTGDSTYTSESTNQIRVGDAVTIGTGSYTVDDTTPDSVFRTTAALAAGDADEDDPAYTPQSTNLTVRFITSTALLDGSFRVLVPAAAANAADGIPDAGYFDFTAGTPTVTCPTDGGGYTFGTATAVASSVTVNSQLYHAFTCPYTGAGGVGSNFTSNPMVITGVINPAPATAAHTAGVANSHMLLIQHRDSGGTAQDSTSVAVGVIEAVKVTATVDPTISFSITGVAAAQTRCGVTTDVTTTALAVPFGVLDLANFVDAAQTLTVSTNAIGGYAVTARENDQLGLDGDTCTGDDTANIDCIRDSQGDSGSMTHTTHFEWNTTAAKGFGYSLEAGTGATTPFEYDTSNTDCTGTFCARQFADAEGSQSPVSVMTHTTVADAHTTHVCYRIIPAVTNAAGNYQNSITYTATATF